MNSKLTRRALLGAGLALPLLGGCGGGAGGSNNAASNLTRGTLALTLTFPNSRAAKPSKPTRVFGGNLPVGARSVQVSVTDPATGAALAPAKLITAPVSANSLPGMTTVQFTSLPVGAVLVKAIVFPDAAAKQNPIATGSATGQIVASTTTTVNVTFTLTLAHFIVSKTRVDVSPSVTDQTHSVTVDAIVQDASSRALLYPIYWLSSDPGIAQVTFDPADPTVATISGVQEGTTVVTLVEPNSGMTATVDVNSFIS